MGGGAGRADTTKKVPRATTGDGDGASVSPVEQQQQPAPLPAAGVGDGPAAVHQSCGEDDQDDDEQVERFYALLANIRALRGLYSAGDGGGTAGGPPASGRGRKRAREAEAPWTPAFRLEDFEQEVNQRAADSRCAVMNQGTSGGVARRPAVAARATAAVVAAADDGGHEEDKAARGGDKLRRRVAARG